MYRVFVSRVALAIALTAIVVPTLSAQAAPSATRRRRENATRRARIARNIEQTYSYRYDFAAGGGFLRFRSGEYLQKNTEITWAVSATRNFSPKWGVIGDVRGMYGNAKLGNNNYNLYKPLITEYTFMVGPSYRFYKAEKLSASVHVLGGAALGNFDGGTHAIAAYRLGMWDTSTSPAFSAGVNLDYNFYPNLAFRVTPTYVGTLFRGAVENADGTKGASNGSVQNHLGINFGIVYRWGHQ